MDRKRFYRREDEDENAHSKGSGGRDKEDDGFGESQQYSYPFDGEHHDDSDDETNGSPHRITSRKEKTQTIPSSMAASSHRTPSRSPIPTFSKENSTTPDRSKKMDAGFVMTGFQKASMNAAISVARNIFHEAEQKWSPAFKLSDEAIDASLLPTIPTYYLDPAPYASSSHKFHSFDISDDQ